ncbi:hypothetical protein XAC2852_580110 [Xanthomonas citri pv. citri]|nr:hypothetical protein XAC2852_580110 [Xanthomonas citri pv. citri]
MQVHPDSRPALRTAPAQPARRLRSAFFGRQRLQLQRVDRPAHQLAQGRIHHAVPRQRRLVDKCGADHGGLEVHAVVAVHVDAGFGQAGFDEFTDGFGVQRAFPHKMSAHSTLRPSPAWLSRTCPPPPSATPPWSPAASACWRSSARRWPAWAHASAASSPRPAGWC